MEIQTDLLKIFYFGVIENKKTTIYLIERVMQNVVKISKIFQRASCWKLPSFGGGITTITTFLVNFDRFAIITQSL